MYSLAKNYFVVIVFAAQLAMSSNVLAKETGYYGLGNIATEEEIAGWDIDVRPDGLGLPAGSGSVADGEPLYEEKCASCHGLFGEGEGRWPKLAGGYDTLTEDRPEKTVGSYWPYASTLWDYIHRAMPFTTPQSLSDAETYAITAYVLYLNEIVDEEYVLTQANFSELEMPNKDGFYIDPRPDIRNPTCMENCKDPKTIKVTSAIKGITPLQHLESNKAAVEERETTSEKEAGLSEVDKQGSDVYVKSCAVCHDSGLAGAPKTGDKKLWKIRIAQSVDVLVKHAIDGFTGDAGVMPAKGGNSALSDEEVAAAVAYMLQQSQ